MKKKAALFTFLTAALVLLASVCYAAETVDYTVTYYTDGGGYAYKVSGKKMKAVVELSSAPTKNACVIVSSLSESGRLLGINFTPVSAETTSLEISSGWIPTDSSGEFKTMIWNRDLQPVSNVSTLTSESILANLSEFYAVPQGSDERFYANINRDSDVVSVYADADLANAQFNVVAADGGSGIVDTENSKITVTSENGKNTKEYTLNVVDNMRNRFNMDFNDSEIVGEDGKLKDGTLYSAEQIGFPSYGSSINNNEYNAGSFGYWNYTDGSSSSSNPRGLGGYTLSGTNIEVEDGALHVWRTSLSEAYDGARFMFHVPTESDFRSKTTDFVTEFKIKADNIMKIRVGGVYFYINEKAQLFTPLSVSHAENATYLHNNLNDGEWHTVKVAQYLDDPIKHGTEYCVVSVWVDGAFIFSSTQYTASNPSGKFVFDWSNRQTAPVIEIDLRWLKSSKALTSFYIDDFKLLTK